MALAAALSRCMFAPKSNVRMFSALTELDASKLVIERTTNPKVCPAPAYALLKYAFDFDTQPKHAKETLKFGATFTDHMLEVDFKAGEGWKTPLISPYHALPIDPAASALHYSLQVRGHAALCCTASPAQKLAFSSGHLSAN